MVCPKIYLIMFSSLPNVVQLHGFVMRYDCQNAERVIINHTETDSVYLLLVPVSMSFSDSVNEPLHGDPQKCKIVLIHTNKKVLLRERKRHTDRRVASTRYAAPGGGGGVPWAGAPMLGGTPGQAPPLPGGYPGWAPPLVRGYPRQAPPAWT